MRVPRRALLVLPLLLALSPAAARADTPSFGTCAPYGDMRVCSGEAPGTDGSPLDFDLTLPMTGGAKHPLIALLHGFGGNKHEWESTTDEGDGHDKWHWNSHWFAEHGYYVLTYTARGFRDDGPDRADEPKTPSGTSLNPPSGVIRLKSKEWEIEDTQTLVAQAAAAFPDLDKQAIAVSGGSYGGGESWLQAADQQAWNDKGLRLQVAVPKYGWTDLGYSLAPNGHGGGPSGTDVYESSTNLPYTSPVGRNPIGVGKASYVTYFYASGQAQGQFQTLASPARSEGPIDINAWEARVSAGPDPYEGDVLSEQIRRGLTDYRGSYYQQDGWAYEKTTNQEVAIFSIQGWTDDLFTPVESFRQFKALKRMDPLWPVSLALGSVGHPRALQSNAATWHRLNDQAWQFLQANINGAHRQQSTVYSEPTICPGQPDDAASMRTTATTPEGLANGQADVAMPSGSLTDASGTGDPNSQQSDPILGYAGGAGPCRTSTAPSTGYTAVSRPLPRPLTYDDLATLTLHGFSWTGTTATVVLRLWDVTPGGATLLVDRGAYRLLAPQDTGKTELVIPFDGDHWVFPAGHQVRVDVVQTDTPAYLPSKQASATEWTSATLSLPTREAGTLALVSA